MPQGAIRARLNNPPENAPRPPELKHIVFSQCKGMKTDNLRIGLDPTYASWLENFFPLAPNNLHSVPGQGAALTTIAGQTWTLQKSVFMKGNHYEICFGDDGSGHQINKATGVDVIFAPAGTFSAPDLTVYRADRILIADPTAGYSTWDTLAFVKQGSVSPNLTVTDGGTSYNTAPTWTISGGSGSGGSGTSTIVDGSVASLELVDPGADYQVGDVLTVTISGGGGTGATASAFVWPFLGFQTLSVAVWQGQVWLIGAKPSAPLNTARILQWSGTTSQDTVDPTSIGYDNFGTSGAGSTSILDEDVAEGLTCVRTLNNFLYIFGSSSVRQIGSKTFSGSPLVTNFSLTTISSDQGTVWKDTVVSYNKFVAFASNTGVFAIFGATVQKVSGPMDGIFQIADFGGLKPQAAVFDLFNKHIAVLLMRIKDPQIGGRNVLVALVDQSWFLLSAGNLLTICSESKQSVFTLWGSSGGDVTPLFVDPASPVSVRWSTALTEDKDPVNNKRSIRAAISQTFGPLTGVLTWAQESESGAVKTTYTPKKALQFVSQFGAINFTNSTGGVLVFVAGGYIYQPLQVQNTGIYIGGTLTGSAVDLNINMALIEYTPSTPMRSI